MTDHCQQKSLPGGAELRDIGMHRAATAQDNAAALEAARPIFQRLIDSGVNFTSADIIALVEAQGITADKWQCIGSMIRAAAKKGLIERVAITASERRSRHCGNQAVWRGVVKEALRKEGVDIS